VKIACIGYRDWALQIYDGLASESLHKFLILRSKEEFVEQTIYDFDPDLILFYGWSWIVSNEMIENYQCVMLHPSKLPKYRGGSPIQNQIIDGVENSAITLFLMNNQLDSGPILNQGDILLSGTIEDIFEQIIILGIKLTKNILDSNLQGTLQDESQATYCERRKPEDSEISIKELQSKPAKYLYNKVRMLQGIYPLPYIVTADNKKLFLHSVSIGEVDFD